MCSSHIRNTMFLVQWSTAQLLWETTSCAGSCYDAETDTLVIAAKHVWKLELLQYRILVRRHRTYVRRTIVWVPKSPPSPLHPLQPHPRLLPRPRPRPRHREADGTHYHSTSPPGHVRPRPPVGATTVPSSTPTLTVTPTTHPLTPLSTAIRPAQPPDHPSGPTRPPLARSRRLSCSSLTRTHRPPHPYASLRIPTPHPRSRCALGNHSGLPPSRPHSRSHACRSIVAPDTHYLLLRSESIVVASQRCVSTEHGGVRSGLYLPYSS